MGIFVNRVGFSVGSRLGVPDGVELGGSDGTAVMVGTIVDVTTTPGVMALLLELVFWSEPLPQFPAPQYPPTPEAIEAIITNDAINIQKHVLRLDSDSRERGGSRDESARTASTTTNDGTATTASPCTSCTGPSTPPKGG